LRDVNVGIPKPIGRHALIRGAGAGSGTERVPPAKTGDKKWRILRVARPNICRVPVSGNEPLQQESVEWNLLKVMCLFIEGKIGKCADWLNFREPRSRRCSQNGILHGNRAVGAMGSALHAAHAKGNCFFGCMRA